MASEAKLAELADLMAQLCDSDLDRLGWERLEALLLDDPEAQQFYRRFIALDVDLAWRGADLAAQPPSAMETTEQGKRAVGGEREQRAGERRASSLLPVAPLPFPRDRPLVLPIFPVLFRSPALAYTVATLVLLVAVAGAWFWSPVGDGRQVAERHLICRPCQPLPGPVRWSSARLPG